jgi:HK97 family phage portal protein
MRSPFQALFDTRGFSLRDPALARLWGGGTSTAAGVSVSEDSAFNIAAYFQGVGMIAADLAGMPLDHLKRDGRKKTNQANSKLTQLFNKAPNPEMTAFIFKETLQGHLLSWGNAFAEIEWNNAMQPIGLWPITPDRVTVLRNGQGRIVYRITPSNRTIEAEDMLHVPGFGFDGLIGYSVIARARQSLGLMAAAERYGATFFGNGASFGGVLTVQNDLDEAQQAELKAKIDREHRGADKAHKLLLLTNVEGMKFERLGIPPNDAQFLETRKFQLAEIARWLNLPLRKLKDYDREGVTASGQQNLDYLTDTMMPWIQRWEAEIVRKLISRSEWNLEYVKLNFASILRGDMKSRYDAYNTAIQAGFFSVNDVLEKEDLDPIDGGDIYRAPLNAMPLSLYEDYWDKKVNPPEPTVVPAAPGTPAGNDPAKDEQVTNLKRELAALEARAAVAADTISQLEQSLSARSVTLDEVQQALGASSAEQVAVRVERDDLVNQLTVLRGIEAGIRADLARTQEALTTREADLEAVRDQVALAEAAQAASQADRADLHQRLDALRETVRASQVRSQSVERDLERQRDLVRARQRELSVVTAERDAVRSEAATLRTERDSHAERRQSTEALRETLSARIVELEAAVGLARRAEGQAVQDLDKALHEQKDATTAEEAARAAVVVLETRIAEMTKTQEQRVGLVLESHRALLVDVMRRMVEYEVEKVSSRTSFAPSALRAWMETYYARHQKLIASALEPALRVHLAWTGATDTPVDLAAALADAEVRSAKTDLLVAIDGEPASMGERLTDLCRRWTEKRADRLASVVVGREVDRRGRTA